MEIAVVRNIRHDLHDQIQTGQDALRAAERSRARRLASYAQRITPLAPLVVIVPEAPIAQPEPLPPAPEYPPEFLALVRAAYPERYPGRTVTVREIQEAVCKAFHVHMRDMCSSRRTANIVLPRQVAMTLAKAITLRSLPDIGRRFAGRDHTTVLHAVRKYQWLAEALRAELPIDAPASKWAQRAFELVEARLAVA